MISLLNRWFEVAFVKTDSSYPYMLHQKAVEQHLYAYWAVAWKSDNNLLPGKKYRYKNGRGLYVGRGGGKMAEVTLSIGISLFVEAQPRHREFSYTQKKV